MVLVLLGLISGACDCVNGALNDAFYQIFLLRNCLSWNFDGSYFHIVVVNINVSFWSDS